MYSHCIIEKSNGSVQLYMNNLKTDECICLDLTCDDWSQLCLMINHWCEGDYTPSDEFKTEEND